MEHLRIIFYSVHLMIGVAAGFYVYLKYRSFKSAFLVPFIYFICFSNLIIFISLITEYVRVNVQGGALVDFINRYLEICAPLGAFFYLGMVYALIRTALALQGLTVSRGWRPVIWMGIPFVAANYAIQFPGAYVDFMSQAISGIISGGYILTLALMFVFLFLLILHAGKCSDHLEKTRWIFFGGFYFIVMLILATLATVQDKSLFWIMTLTLLLLNIFPFIWTRRTLVHAGLSDLLETTGEIPLSCILDRFQVSKREMQIAELILRGKSNKEIQEALFISLHTVKNHIYSLYQKLGVKSRGQLVNLILVSRRESCDEDKAPG